MKRSSLLTTLLALLLLSACSDADSQNNSAQTFSLFNGTDLTGWHYDIPAMDENPDTTNAFIVRDGMLVSLGVPLGHLITDETYSDYRLVAEYRFPGEPGNCGILVHASDKRELYGMFPKSIEVQKIGRASCRERVEDEGGEGWVDRNEIGEWRVRVHRYR